MKKLFKLFFGKKLITNLKYTGSSLDASYSGKHVDPNRVVGDAVQQIISCHLATLSGTKRAEIERITTSVAGARGVDSRAHANKRDEKEVRHSSFNYKFH